MINKCHGSGISQVKQNDNQLCSGLYKLLGVCVCVCVSVNECACVCLQVFIAPFILVSFSVNKRKAGSDKSQVCVRVCVCWRVYLSDHLVLVGADEARQAAGQGHSYQLKQTWVTTMAGRRR